MTALNVFYILGQIVLNKDQENYNIIFSGLSNKQVNIGNKTDQVDVLLYN